MAGKGLRFIKENFTEPKPLIKVSGKPMVFQTIDHLPKSDFNVFLLRQDMDKINVLKKLIKQKFKRPLIQTLDHITLGQACTAFEAISNLKRNSYF